MIQGRFKIDLKRALNALLPFAKANPLDPDLWMEEYRKYQGRIRPERIFYFDSYQMILTYEKPLKKEDEKETIVMCSFSTKGRNLSDEEKNALVETFSETFPDAPVHRIDGSLLPGATAFKVFVVDRQAVT